MPVLTDADYRGALILKKRSGVTTPIAVGTQFVIPSALINPSNPGNNGYMQVINAAVHPANVVLGKKTPSVVVSTFWKPSYCTANLFNDLLLSSDTNLNTSEYDIGIWDGRTTRVFGGARCAGITFRQAAMGGPIQVEMAFLARYGDSEGPAVTFSNPTGPDGGQFTNVSQMDWGATPTADCVTGWEMSLVRRQEYLACFDQTLYMAEIATGPFAGTLSIGQYTRSATVPSTAATLRVGASGAGVIFNCDLNLDEYKRVHSTSLGAATRSYSIVDLDGSGTPAITISAW